ncbi:MAG: purine nucleoside permease [Pseudomonadota bacterium]
MPLLRSALPLAVFFAVLGGCAATQSDTGTSTGRTSGDCQPGGPCSTPIPIKVVIVTMFEIGEDEGDRAGEFQLWKARRGLTQRIPVPHGHHDLFLNPETGVLGFVTGVGTMNSAATTMALGLDQRFDLSEAYWLVAGIAGIDPEDASVGSAAWSAYLVDGDLGHEIDAREMPADWPHGFFARRTQGPLDPTPPDNRGEMFLTNVALRDWAYELTKDVPLPDAPALAALREEYVGYPNAQRPPFVLKGGHIAAMTFWHGKLMNDWANDYVRFWSGGATDYVTSAMEETGTFQSMTYLHEIGRVNKHRFLVLRAGSNYAMPPPGRSAADNLLAESKQGYSGLEVSVESLYRVGSVVIDTLLRDWERYRRETPGADPVQAQR